MHSDIRANDIASVQGGVIRRDQAIESGLTPNQIDGRLRTERWSRVTDGGYRVFAMPGKLNLVRSAVVLLPDAVASHSSAAAIHNMSKVDRTEVSVLVHSQTTHVYPGVRVFRSHDLRHDHVVMRSGIPTTTIARTITDLSGIVSKSHLETIVDDNTAARVVKLEDIRRVLEDVARSGKPGVGNLRSILDARLGDDYSPTALESAGRALLVEAGITGFKREYPVPWSDHSRFDLAFPRSALAIEWDSRRWHTQAAAIRADRARDRRAILHGWRVLRFTWDDVHLQPEMVVHTIEDTLSAST